METITLPTQLVQQLVNYLTTRPWGEVNAFITTLLEAAKPVAVGNGGLDAGARRSRSAELGEHRAIRGDAESR